jgi:hypothetical protein
LLVVRAGAVVTVEVEVVQAEYLVALLALYL